MKEKQNKKKQIVDCQMNQMQSSGIWAIIYYPTWLKIIFHLWFDRA